MDWATERGQTDVKAAKTHILYFVREAAVHTKSQWWKMDFYLNIKVTIPNTWLQLDPSFYYIKLLK